MYTSMWITKPTQGKMTEAKKMMIKFRHHWKRHGAVEAQCAMLHGAYYVHLAVMDQCKKMEHFGKANDAVAIDNKVQTDLAKADALGEIVTHFFGRRIED